MITTTKNPIPAQENQRICAWFVICRSTYLPPRPSGAVSAQPLCENLSGLFRNPTALIPIDIGFTILCTYST